MKRLLLLLLQTYLKIAIILANSGHSCFLRICKVIADVFQLPVTHLLNDSTSTEDSEGTIIPYDISSKISISTQTEENINQQVNTVEKTGTDVIIYNLNSTQKLVISQATLRSECKNCKSVTQIPLEKTKDETVQTEFETPQTTCMSIENDVIDSNIVNGYSSSSNSSQEEILLESTRDEFNCLQVDTTNPNDKVLNADNNKENDCVDSDTFDIVSSNTCNDRFSLSTDLKYLNKDSNATYLHSQNTSSPIETLQSTQALFTNLSRLNAHNQSQTKRIKDTETSIKSDYWKRDALASNFRRRLSLPAKLNTTKSTINFKLAQEKLIEETLKNTPRHEKSVKKIKYPFSSDISLDLSKPNDGMEDKEVFSCSSYESLPVSDHLRNAFENNTLLNACNESLYTKEIPELICVDDFVEDFNDDQSFQSVERTLVSSSLLKTENNDSLYVDKNLQRSYLQSNSSNSNKSKGNPKPRHNFKKRMISSFTSESDLNVSDVVKELNKLIDSEKVMVSENFSKLCNEELSNNLLDSYVNSENNESDMNEDELSHSQTKNKFFEHPNLKQEIEEALEKYALGSDVSEDFENNISSIIDSVETKPSDYHKYYYQIAHQTDNDILIIDENPPNEQNQAIQNISEANCQSLLNEDDKMFCKENILRKSKKEISKFGYEDLLPNQLHTTFQKMEEYEENQSNKSKSSENPNESMLSDQFQWSGESENTVLIEKETNASDNLEQTLQQFHKELNEGLLDETRSTNECVSEGDCQNKTLEDQKPNLRRKRNKRNKRSKNKAQISELKTPSPVQQQYSRAALLSDEKSPLDKNGACQNILQVNNQAHHTLNEDETTKPLEKKSSSGDSASDNSVVTVKDLSVVEGKIEENLPSENDC